MIFGGKKVVNLDVELDSGKGFLGGISVNGALGQARGNVPTVGVAVQNSLKL